MLTLHKIGHHRVMIYLVISFVEIAPLDLEIFEEFLPYMDIVAILVM